MRYVCYVMIPALLSKRAEKGSAVLFSDRDDYIREANSQRGERNIYQEVKGDARGFLIEIIKIVYKKFRNRSGIHDETLEYFFVNNPKLGRFFFAFKD